ncbi:MAG TPA: 2-C-methyl-D-erythritol 4-phosphate cytidylyltransferase [Tepidisphaeraceae bacterium]|jgi:2-C-methyl-D-erythritol 4-phosphate cytidylyltransferase
MPDFAVILPAGGKAVRFGGERNKLLYPLQHITILRRSVQAFLARKDCAQVIVPTRDPAMIDELSPLRDARIQTPSGGESRAESVLRGLQDVRREVQWVAVHDAARPLVSQQLIDTTLAAAEAHGAAAPALPVALTIKQASGPLPAKVQQTVPRQNLWAMQTPQIMRTRDLLDAYDRCPLPLAEVTDDVQLLELVGKPVYLVAGEERNLKITTPLDLRLAEILAPS